MTERAKRRQKSFTWVTGPIITVDWPNLPANVQATPGHGTAQRRSEVQQIRCDVEPFNGSREKALADKFQFEWQLDDWPIASRASEAKAGLCPIARSWQPAAAAKKTATCWLQPRPGLPPLRVFDTREFGCQRLVVTQEESPSCFVGFLSSREKLCWPRDGWPNTQLHLFCIIECLFSCYFHSNAA
jgi:hypothetical protein